MTVDNTSKSRMEIACTIGWAACEAAGLAVLSGQPIKEALSYGVAAGGVEAIKVGIFSPTPRKEFVETATTIASTHIKASHAAKIAETLKNEAPAVTAAAKADRVDEGQRITRLASGALPPAQRAKLDEVEKRRIGAAMDDPQARQMLIRRHGAKEAEALRQKANATVKASVKAKAPRVS